MTLGQGSANPLSDGSSSAVMKKVMETLMIIPQVKKKAISPGFGL
jgi:hypothetical protein